MEKADSKKEAMKPLATKLPPKLIEAIDAFVVAGYYNSRSDAIRVFVREGLQKKKAETSDVPAK